MTTLPVLLTPSSTEIKLPEQPLRVLAIDLGTTNSTVAQIVCHRDEGLAGPARWARAPELGLKQNENLFFECKNEIGHQKTYHRAPRTAFRTSGARILRNGRRLRKEERWRTTKPGIEP